MNARATFVGCLLALCAAGALQSAAAPARLHYEPAVVQLSGTVVIESQFGRPNYGENPATDEQVKIAVLELDRPVSVVGDPKSDFNQESVDNIQRMQLVDLKGGRFSPYAGKHVRVSGTLFHAITGHHYTDVLLTVRTIQQSR